MRCPSTQVFALIVAFVATVEVPRASLEPPKSERIEAEAPLSRQAQIERPLAPIADPAPVPRLAEAVTHKLGSWGLVYLPAGLPLGDGGYDLIVHFHGGSLILNPKLDAAGSPRVLCSINLGIGSRVYMDHFAAPHALERTLEAIDAAVSEHAPKGATKRRRLALSAWSAGYGAIQRILGFEHNLPLIDAVVVEDGLHGSFANRPRRVLAPASLAPFARFAELAAAGDKLMLVTHSAVETYGYASTTETARHLVDAFALAPCDDAPEPEGMRSTSCHRRGALRVFGYAGNDKPAHAAHLLHFRELVLVPLDAAWAGESGRGDDAIAGM